MRTLWFHWLLRRTTRQRTRLLLRVGLRSCGQATTASFCGSWSNTTSCCCSGGTALRWTTLCGHSFRRVGLRHGFTWVATTIRRGFRIRFSPCSILRLQAARTPSSPPRSASCRPSCALPSARWCTTRLTSRDSPQLSGWHTMASISATSALWISRRCIRTTCGCRRRRGFRAHASSFVVLVASRRRSGSNRVNWGALATSTCGAWLRISVRCSLCSMRTAIRYARTTTRRQN